MPKNHPLELNRAVPGGRVETFAIRDDDYPGGWFYRFQYYHSEDGEILRFGDDTEIEFHGIVPHVTRFLNEIAELTNTENSTHD